MTWLVFWLVFYLLLTIILITRHVKSGDIENYLVNNRKTRTFPLVATTLATEQFDRRLHLNLDVCKKTDF